MEANILIFCACNLIYVIFVILFIVRQRRSRNDNEVEAKRWNYRLGSFSRLTYLMIIPIYLIHPLHAIQIYQGHGFDYDILYLFLPLFIMLIVNIMAHREQNINIQLHFIVLALCSISFLMTMASIMDGFLITSDLWFALYVIVACSLFSTAAYAFLAWIVALSHRNDK